MTIAELISVLELVKDKNREVCIGIDEGTILIADDCYYEED